MNKNYLLGVFCLLTFYLGYGQRQQIADTIALDEVVITDSKFELEREKSGKVITKISSQELSRLQGKSVAEILNSVVGFEINGSRSNAGQNLGYFVRGGRNRQVLVLIDGIALSDPSQISNDYDLRLLASNQVESIEIMRGASSSLYGSGAATAVINVKLKRPSNNSNSITLSSAVGTNMSSEEDNYALEDFRNSVSVTGKINDFSYLSSFGNQYTNGLSAISAGNESDPYNAIHGHLKLGYEFSESFRLDAYGGFDQFKADFDDSFTGMDADNVSLSDQYRIGLSSEFNYDQGSVVLNGAYNNISREIQSDFPSKFNAESGVIDIYNRYNFDDRFYALIGLNGQLNSMDNQSIPFGSSNFEETISSDDATFNIVDPYMNVVYVSDLGLNLNAGARLNIHSEYGSQLVYNINPSYRKALNFGYIKGLASYSTSYITPSLFQLFEPNYGNPELNPEESATFEVGAEVNFKSKATVSLVYFNRREKNFIDFMDLGDFVFQYNNISETFNASGLELVANYTILEGLDLNVNATYTHLEDDLSLRIPEIRVNARLDYAITSGSFISLRYQYNDDRTDSVFNTMTFMSEQVNLSSFSLLDLYFSQKLIQNKMTIFVNLTNLFNTEYEELSGFSTRGRNVNLGFELSL